VPPIGTIVTQGGVSGYLLGVYFNISQAPNNPGTTMPTEGFIKFREVDGGAFVAGALSGIGATATGPDRASWIEVVMDQSTAITVPRLGFFRTRGTWYEIPQLTDGTANQFIDMPNNGGAIGNPIWPAIWIETAPGSNEFEAYPSMPSTIFTPTNVSADQRSKFVCALSSNGTIVIGGNAIDECGYVPPAGCRIRIPNIIGRQTSAANRSFNLVPASTLGARPDFTTTAAGEIDCEYFINDWYHLFSSAFKVRMVHCATMDIHTSSNEASPSYLEDYAIGKLNSGTIPLTMTNNSLGGQIINCKFIRNDGASNGHAISLTGCTGYTMQNVTTGVVAFSRSSGAVVFSQCRNFVIDGLKTFNIPVNIITSANFTITNRDYTDRLVGSTNTAATLNCFNLTISSDNILIDGLAFGLSGLIENAHPYGALLSMSNCSNVTLRNAGTFSSRIGGTVNPPSVIIADGGNNDTVRCQRVYLSATRTSISTTANSSKNISLDHCYGTNGAVQFNSNNTIFKGVRAASALVTGQASVYGSHWLDIFLSDTVGSIAVRFNEPTAFSADQFEVVSSGPNFGFTSAGQLVMPNVGDEIVWTMPYFSLGHVSFNNNAPVVTGSNTGNMALSYDIDTGSGFSGTYKNLTAPNLETETITPNNGFKLKIRALTTVANSGNALTTIRVITNSTAIAQESNLYPLDFATISLSGIRPGSRVQIYDLTNTAEIFNQIVNSDSLAFSAPFLGEYLARVRVMFATSATADQFIEFQDLVTINGLSRSVSPEVDSIYTQNGVDGFSVTGIAIDDSALLLEIQDGVLTWADIYAYETAWLTTEQGIRDEGRFIEAIDSANYLLSGFKIKNVSSPSAPLVITGGWGRDSVTNQTVTLIDTTGGTIFSSPDLVVSIAIGSGLSPAQDATLSKLDALTENVGGLRFTTKALEESPSGGGSGGSGDWTNTEKEQIRNRLGIDGTKSTPSSVPTLARPSDIPTASQNAAQVRTELSTELARIDAATSTRLATASYTAPANSDIAAIKAKTDTLVNAPTLLEIEGSLVLAKESTVASRASQASVNAIPTNPLLTTDLRLNNLDDTISSRLPLASYVAPANLNIELIKLKTDNLPALPASEVTLAAKPSVAQVRAEIDASLAAYDAPTKSELDSAIASLPTAGENALAVRSELATELSRVDTNISSRNAVAPDNANIAAIKAKVDTLENTDTSGLATSGQIEQVKKNTDLIPATL
jgi:hypothetical protein